MKVTVIYQILLASLLLVGCTKVDLCDETTHPHVVDGFSVTYNWNELAYLPMKRLRNYIL